VDEGIYGIRQEENALYKYIFKHKEDLYYHCISRQNIPSLANCLSD